MNFQRSVYNGEEFQNKTDTNVCVAKSIQVSSMELSSIFARLATTRGRLKEIAKQGNGFVTTWVGAVMFVAHLISLFLQFTIWTRQ